MGLSILPLPKSIKSLLKLKVFSYVQLSVSNLRTLPHLPGSETCEAGKRLIFMKTHRKKNRQSQNSLVLGGGLENEAAAVVFIVCTLIRESKNNSACNADFGTGPCSFSQARQPWEPLIVWHTGGTASTTKHRAGQPFLWIKYVRDDKNLPRHGKWPEC